MKQSVLQLRVDNELKEAVMKQAEKKKMTVSALLTMYVMQGLSNETKMEQMQDQVIQKFFDNEIVKKMLEEGLQMKLPVE